MLLAVGSQTKAPLFGDDAALISMNRFTGITQYEPSEFTFTAKAGTPLKEISETLADKGQYLPFDPLLSESGATIGGTVAAGLSGPGRQRYGGIRDFLLGVQFVAGDGAVINSGGKVVKNAAGFDVPKLMVGSLGRLGVMTELTFKVFPRPVVTMTLRVACSSHEEALKRIARAANSRWELDAIDYTPGDAAYLRLGGPTDANEALSAEIKAEWDGDVSDVPQEESTALWKRIGELQPRDGDTSIAKVPSTPQRFLALQTLCEARDDMQTHLSVAGAVAWVWLQSAEAVKALDDHLSATQHVGLLMCGRCEQTKWLGRRRTSDMESRIRRAMDPDERFAPL